MFGIAMKVVEHWDDLLQRREGTDITGHIANSVERDLVADRFLIARFAFVVKISKYSIMDFLWFFGGGRGCLDQKYSKGGTNEVLKSW